MLIGTILYLCKFFILQALARDAVSDMSTIPILSCLVINRLNSAREEKQDEKTVHWCNHILFINYISRRPFSQLTKQDLFKLSLIPRYRLFK